MSPSSPGDAAADAELRALLQQLKAARGLTYDKLAGAANMARGSVSNYISKPGHRRDTQTLVQLLGALGPSAHDRERALELHRQTRPARAGAAEVGWQARARAASCTVWAMAEFTASEATVHTAIGRRQINPPSNVHAADPPTYVYRRHDDVLRRNIASAAAREFCGLIVVRGTSSTGKTRSLFEAVHALCGDWTVIRPRSATAARSLPASGLFDRPVVVWLNELQGFLGPSSVGLSLDVLRDLYEAATAPVVLIGTLWPDRFHALTDGTDQSRSDTRELLSNDEWVLWHDVQRTLTTNDEWTAARALAEQDARLAAAVADADRFGFAQTLAGARELLEHYQASPTEPARLLLEAAADARRLGHRHALTEPLLRALTLALWREDHGPARPPDTRWFDVALTYAVAPLRSDDGVRALIPLDDPDTSVLDTAIDSAPSGYDLADYLEQHLTHARRLRPVLDQVWDALRAHTSRADDLQTLAQAASDRGRYQHNEALYRAAAAAGDPTSLRRLAWWLSQGRGRETEVETVYREAAAAGDPAALTLLAGWLSSKGRRADADAVYREAAAAGAPAGSELVDWMGSWPGRRADADIASDWARLRALAFWRQHAGQNADTEAEAVYREAADAGDPAARHLLARWLSQRPEWEADVEAVYREAAAAGDPDALPDLASWMGDLPGREADAEAVYREAAAAGDPVGLRYLASWLSQLPGRETDAEAVYREAAAAGDPVALRYLASWLSQLPGRETDAEAVYREAAAAGDPDAPRYLARWLSQRPEREADTDATWRYTVAAGDPGALTDLVGWLATQPGRKAEADLIRRLGLDAYGRTIEADPGSRQPQRPTRHSGTT